MKWRLDGHQANALPTKQSLVLAQKHKKKTAIESAC